ncbi:MAG: hypothetical protein VKM98_05995 [Cyanobacteriota bacterium]|nr:hypothetical protein [Cyanobacteriota bacterium]
MDRAFLNASSALGAGGHTARHYRLVDQQGSPHPVLDDLYDSLDAAWDEARAWWQEQFGCERGPVEIGIEVSTGCGSWRTLRHPGS